MMTSTNNFIEKIYDKLVSNWSQFLVSAQNQTLDIDFENQYPFLRYFENNYISCAVLDVRNFKLIYQNNYFYTLYGINAADYLQYGDKLVLSQFESNMMEYNSLLLKNYETLWESLKTENRKNIRVCTSGLVYLHPMLGKRRIFMQSMNLKCDAQGYPLYTLVLHQDITHLVKGDFFWIRLNCEAEPDKQIVYHSENKEVLKGDIFSNREQEILNLIVKGKSPDEIAQILYISKITVNNHRQNMLNRIGVKDTTALVELVKLSKMYT